jgi:hypothetical protein
MFKNLSRLSNEEIELLYLESAAQKYKNLYDLAALRLEESFPNKSSSLSPSFDEQKHLRYFYREGVISNKVFCDFRTFSQNLLDRVNGRNRNYAGFNRYWNRLWSRRSDWYSYHGVKYRQKQKYQKRDGHAPKQLSDSEQSNSDWRDKKGFHRSRSKFHWRSGIKSRSISERASSRTFRQMEKSCIKNEDWDSLADSNALSRLIRDPWNWD